MSDPTLILLRELDEPGKYHVTENVPIIKPHIRKDEKGTELYRVTEQDLPRIAATCTQLEKRSGVVGRMTLGHVRPGRPPGEQPKLVGYARNFRAGTFGPSAEPAVLATLYCKPEHLEEAREYPFRSAEFYADLDRIAGVALLKTDPALDLGMVVLETGERCFFYSMDSGATAPIPPSIAEKPEMELLMKHLRTTYPHLDKMHAAYAAQNAGVGSSTGVSIPKLESTMSDKKPEDYEGLQGRLVLLEKQATDLIALNSAQAEKITLLESVNVMQSYERELAELWRDHVFDMAEEMQDVQNANGDGKPMTREQFDRHKKRMQKYEKRPHAVGALTNGHIARQIAGAGREPTPQQHDAAIKMATDKKISYEAALAEVAK